MMTFSPRNPILRKPTEDLTVEDVTFILSVAIESLKTAHHALSLLKDVAPNLPLSHWGKGEGTP